MRKNIFFLILTFTLLLAQALFCQEKTPSKAASQISVEKIGTYPCGRQPKQVLFSPDGKFIVMPLLEDNGFDIFSVEEKKVVKRINPPNAKKEGFAEGLFIPAKNAFFVSQMTTGNIYEYSYPGFEFRRTVYTHGNWSKFIAWCPEKNMVAVSNWISNDISLLDYDSGKLLGKLKTGAAPRGMVFLDGGKNLLSLSFDSGVVEKFEVDSFKRIDSIKIPKACMRHVILSKDSKYAFISDMYNCKVYKLELAAFKIVSSVKIYINPNTIDLFTSGGHSFIFASTRGPNNPKDYTKRSPSNGKIHIIDADTMSIVKTFYGGNQPTGLDVSPDGSLLCFSNFQDANIELYKITCE